MPEKLLLYALGDEFWKKTLIFRTESWEVSYGFVLAQGKIEKKGQSGMCSNEIIKLCASSYFRIRTAALSTLFTLIITLYQVHFVGYKVMENPVGSEIFDRYSKTGISMECFGSYKPTKDPTLLHVVPFIQVGHPQRLSKHGVAELVTNSKTYRKVRCPNKVIAEAGSPSACRNCLK